MTIDSSLLVAALAGLVGSLVGTLVALGVGWRLVSRSRVYRRLMRWRPPADRLSQRRVTYYCDIAHHAYQVANSIAALFGHRDDARMFEQQHTAAHDHLVELQGKVGQALPLIHRPLYAALVDFIQLSVDTLRQLEANQYEPTFADKLNTAVREVINAIRSGVGTRPLDVHMLPSVPSKADAPAGE